MAALQPGSPQHLIIEAFRAGRLRIVVGDRLIAGLQAQLLALLDDLNAAPRDPARDAAQDFCAILKATSGLIRDRPFDATLDEERYLVMLATRAHADWLVVLDPTGIASPRVVVTTAAAVLNLLA